MRGHWPRSPEVVVSTNFSEDKSHLCASLRAPQCASVRLCAPVCRALA